MSKSLTFQEDPVELDAHDVERLDERAVIASGTRQTATRADLLDAVYVSCPSLSRTEAREIFEMTLEEITETLVRGEQVKLRSFGLFSVREKRERMGRNPRTGVEVPITPRRVLTFKASPVLLARVNGRTADGGED